MGTDGRGDWDKKDNLNDLLIKARQYIELN